MQLVLYIKNRTYIEQCNAIVFIARFGLRLCRDGNKGLYQQSKWPGFDGWLLSQVRDRWPQLA